MPLSTLAAPCCLFAQAAQAQINPQGPRRKFEPEPHLVWLDGDEGIDDGIGVGFRSFDPAGRQRARAQHHSLALSFGLTGRIFPECWPRRLAARTTSGGRTVQRTSLFTSDQRVPEFAWAFATPCPNGNSQAAPATRRWGASGAVVRRRFSLSDEIALVLWLGTHRAFACLPAMNDAKTGRRGRE